MNLTKKVTFFLLFLSFRSFSQNKSTNVTLVDPPIGGVGSILKLTQPKVHLPNSMVRVFPVRRDHLDDHISYFPLTISSHRQLSLSALNPISENIQESTWIQSTPYDQEKTTPYFNSVRVEYNGNIIEFSPRARTGYFKFNFNNNYPHYLCLGVLNNGEINGKGKRIITGSENVDSLPAFFYAETDTAITGTQFPNVTDKKQALIQVGQQPQVVGIRYESSFISVEQANQNLQKEIPDGDFEKVINYAFQAWDKALSQLIFGEEHPLT